MKSTVVYLTDEQHETIRRIAFNDKTSMTEIVRNAIDAWIPVYESGKTRKIEEARQAKAIKKLDSTPKPTIPSQSIFKKRGDLNLEDYI